MCLFVVDGTWSRNFNSKSLGIDSSDKPVGNHEKLAARSNSRRFFEESFYPINKKFYYGGPRFGVTGADSKNIYQSVISDIEREIVSGNCTELSLVGWSRGAAIISEVVQNLMRKEFARIYKKVSNQTRRGIRYSNIVTAKSKMIPNIKFVGLFDSVAMIPSIFFFFCVDSSWGEEIPKQVDYFVHVVAGDRTGPIPKLVNFVPREPKIKAKRSVVVPIASASHGEVGGFSNTRYAQVAYHIMKFHSLKSRVK